VAAIRLIPIAEFARIGEGGEQRPRIAGNDQLHQRGYQEHQREAGRE